jgi:hypothetical protein
MILKTIRRLILIPIAFLLSAVGASFVIFTLGAEKITHAMHATPAGEDTVRQMLDLATQGSLLASGVTIVPALAVIIIGEVARIRSWLYYMIGGGVALGAIPLLALLGTTGTLGFALATLCQVFATAGFAGGLVYWLIAGRSA